MTKIITARPPNFAAIAQVFPGAYGEGVIFAYAPDIYAPNHTELPPEILAHEQVHIDRQLKQGVKEWWAQYLVDYDFRLEEEILAHQAEYLCLIKTASRQVRRSALKAIAKKLASPLYGKMLSFNDATAKLKEMEAF